MKKLQRILACMFVIMIYLGLCVGSVWAKGPQERKGSKRNKAVVIDVTAEGDETETTEGEETEQMPVQAKNCGQAKKLGLQVKVRGMNMKFDIPPVVKEGRTLIPVRAIMNGFGAEVTWDEATKTVTVVKDDKTIVLNLADGTATVNGESVTTDIPARIISNRTFVPLRFIAETLGEKVSYDESTGEIDIGDEEDGDDEDIDGEDDEEDNEDVVDEEDDSTADDENGEETV